MMTSRPLRMAAAALGRLTALLSSVFVLLMPPPGGAQATAGTSAVFEKLQRAGLIDPYFPESVLELALPLAQAAGSKWQRVQVNAPWRRDTLNIYLVDAAAIKPDFSLADQGIPEFNRDVLSGGALSNHATQIIFLNTASSKRAAAAAVLQRTQDEPLIRALALVDTAGLDASEPLWSPAALNSASKPIQNAVLLLRGALTFVLAHEMGHLLNAAPGLETGPAAVQPQRLTDRQKDERYACPEMRVGAQAQHAAESAADLTATRLLGMQCRIGSDGAYRHAINQMGMQWYFLAAMSDKMLQAAKSTQSPIIAGQVRQLLGPRLYQDAVVAPYADERKDGAVKALFHSSHPPDYLRVLAIETALAGSPCGGRTGDHTMAKALEELQLRTCRDLATNSTGRR